MVSAPNQAFPQFPVCEIGIAASVMDGRYEGKKVTAVNVHVVVPPLVCSTINIA